MAQTNVVRIGNFNQLSEDLYMAIEGFLNYCKAKNLSSNTIIYYRNRLQAFSKYVEATSAGIAPKDITSLMLREFLTDETETHSASTANHSFVSMNAFFNFLVRDGFLTVNPMVNVDKPKRRKTVIDTFTIEQVEGVLSNCGKDFIGRRDRAMVLIMLDCGLRVSELCGLTLDDINWTEQTLLVLGKGNMERVVPFGITTRQGLNEYIVRRGELDCRMLFVNVYGEPIDRFRARRIIQQRCKNAGITGVRCSPHTFRHTCAVSYLRNGGDVFSLQKLLGHSDLTMTRKYAELSQTDVQDKHRLYSPADRLRSANTSSGRKRLR